MAASDMGPMVVDTSVARHTPLDNTPPMSPAPSTPTHIALPPSPSPPQTPTSRMLPITPQDAHMSTASLATIALSDSDLDDDHTASDELSDVQATPRVSSKGHLRRPSSIEMLQSPPLANFTIHNPPVRNIPHETPTETPVEDEKEHRVSAIEPDQTEISDEGNSSRAPSIATSNPFISPASSRLPSVSSMTTPRRASSSSEDTTEVDWQQLDKNEEQEKEDLPGGTDDESTAFLLARLEQENAKFSQDPKSALTPFSSRTRSGSRPPSMGHLKKLVQARDTPSIRYSLAPDMVMPEEPPPMTELEFWAALVQDYTSTATRLPTLTTSKIRAGIPPPLRGVVWASMSGARERFLEESFDKLLGEQSPYEGIINKDVGRSFPGVELFRDAEGEGQKMLGRVLKCFSLHDKDIGYCQGLGFLVGPLLMNMGEKEAFCVLVRLMDHYSLRPSFLPSLSGLHMRIFQFSSLLKQHLPKLSEHFTQLGVEPAYLSQWFLSCFAVTCPLPMLFRIYDVIFAEGANETVMRVALALMRRNEQQMLDSTEFEDVIQLLLGRAMWDSYACNADDLVDDFTSLGHIITHTKLAELEKEFDNQSSEAVGQSAGFLPSVQGAAGRFLGRLWAPTVQGSVSKSAATLSPQSAEKDASTYSRTPSFFLRKSPSKQSISTVNDSNGSEASNHSYSMASLASTTPTDADATFGATDGNTDAISVRSKAESLNPLTMPGASKEQQELHNQIEDLLTAIGEMQRENSQLTTMLQKEREERNEDHRLVRQLLSRLQTGKENEKEDETSPVDPRRKTLPPPPREQKPKARPVSLQASVDKGILTKDPLSTLVEKVEGRLETNSRFSMSFETKAQLRTNLTRAREQLAAAEAHSRDLSERLEVTEGSLPAFQSENDELRAEVRELRVRVNEEFQIRQKLEFTMREMKAEARSIDRKSRDRMSFVRTVSLGQVPSLSRNDRSPDGRTDTPSSAPSSMGSGGLRELRLGKGRTESTGSTSTRMRAANRRRSEIQTPSVHITSHTTSLEALTAGETSTPPLSPFDTPPIPETPTSEEASNFALPVQNDSPFARRTSSLATQEVFATNKHETVPEEALLLELVNAKTAEAQARQEVDEVKRAMTIAKNKNEHVLAQLQAEMAYIKEEAKKSAEAAEAAKAELAASSIAPSTSSTVAGAKDGEERKSSATTPTGFLGGASTSAHGGNTGSIGGGWFSTWSRRTPSTTKAPIIVTSENKE
ncbi:isoform c of ecotropic viral integration site 5 like protein [Acrodontium crateriforme]|uniref:Isoform c of ecotropic viral integration site 5 like protein n=1 Tax=Acrodontium crateriforme TaxID=150365 RepID=A0AAQ3M7T9_9PEZI|nr:isoform c of ecotropic viral integration site 5 like protein [Acrodontium crateriforme]